MEKNDKKSNKTAAIIGMLTRTSDDSTQNPIINEEFKEDVIHSRGKAPKMRASSSKQPTVKSVGINVISELVDEWLPETIRRFKCCDCEICKAEMTVEAMNEIPPKYVSIKNDKDFVKVASMKEKNRRNVINQLVKIALKSKNNPKHKRIS